MEVIKFLLSLVFVFIVIPAILIALAVLFGQFGFWGMLVLIVILPIIFPWGRGRRPSRVYEPDEDAGGL